MKFTPFLTDRLKRNLSTYISINCGFLLNFRGSVVWHDVTNSKHGLDASRWAFHIRIVYHNVVWKTTISICQPITYQKCIQNTSDGFKFSTHAPNLVFSYDAHPPSLFWSERMTFKLSWSLSSGIGMRKPNCLTAMALLTPSDVQSKSNSQKENQQSKK